VQPRARSIDDARLAPQTHQERSRRRQAKILFCRRSAIDPDASGWLVDGNASETDIGALFGSHPYSLARQQLLLSGKKGGAPTPPNFPARYNNII
jgi:hypothetical protein